MVSAAPSVLVDGRVKESVSPSTSLSLPNTLIARMASSLVDALSATATGPSLVPLTMNRTSCVAVPPLPSSTVTV